jgi:hypothetical protein
MSKLNLRSVSTSFPALFAGWAESVRADTFTITFDSAVSAAVPFSDWLAPGLSVLLALASLAVIKRKGGRRLFVFGAALVVGAGALSQWQDTNAVVQTPLTTSPYVQTISCDQPPQTFTSGITEGIRLTNLTTTGEFHIAVDVDSTCHVGTVLTPSTTCLVVFDSDTAGICPD